MKTQSIIHDIALCWKNNNKDVRPYAKFDEYFLSPYQTSDFYNHIHIFYDSKPFQIMSLVRFLAEKLTRAFSKKIHILFTI